MGIKIGKLLSLSGNKANVIDNDRPFQKNNTTKLLKEIQKCENDAEFNRLFDNERAAVDSKINMTWSVEYTNKLKGRVQISDAKYAELCIVNVKTANKWRYETPKKREHYIAIACVFGLGESGCSRIMNRFGGYDALDKKNPNDIIYIRLLQISERPVSEFDDERRSVYRDLLGVYDAIKWCLDSGDVNFASKKLEELGDTEFIGMYKYANSFSESSVGKLHDEIVACIKKMGYYSKDAFFKDKKLHSMYPKAMSNMSRPKDKILPKRNLLISLFLHMALPLEKINELLGMVNMEPLCSKNPYESTLIHVLTQLYRQHPEFKNEKIMLSSENNRVQGLLKEGTLYMFVNSRMKSFTKRLEEDEVNVNECMYRNLSTEKEKEVIEQ